MADASQQPSDRRPVSYTHLFVLMLTLKEHPLATKVNHTGHPGDTV